MVVMGWGFLFGFWIRLLGLGFLVDGVSGLWCGAFWVFLRVGAHYINIEE